MSGRHLPSPPTVSAARAAMDGLAEVRALADAGYSQTGIAIELGRSETYVRRRIGALGLTAPLVALGRPRHGKFYTHQVTTTVDRDTYAIVKALSPDGNVSEQLRTMIEWGLEQIAEADPDAARKIRALAELDPAGGQPEETGRG